MRDYNPENLFESSGSPTGMVARDYQIKDHDESFRLWGSGVRGVLTRAATGLGKTFMACYKIRPWLNRGPNYRAMIISYERQLVSQFAQEVEEFLGLTPGIEMADDYIHPDAIPKVVVASRQSLLLSDPPSQEVIGKLADFGVTFIGACTQKACKKFLSYLRKGGSVDEVTDQIARITDLPESRGGSWSRVHKFPWQLNWLLIFDEAHRHAHSLKSVGHIVDWFDQNPESRRNGLTATPKRGDKVSIGHKMFPGVALDYPLYHATKPCAVKEGWAVPYIQRYIEVEGVDFRNIAKVKGDFDEASLERILGEEGTLAKLVQPLLDMVGDRRTLIFSPGVEMAKNVARFINARVEVECPQCLAVSWKPVKLVEEWTPCKCGALLGKEHITKSGEQAKSLDGSSSDNDRKLTYKAHQHGRFQFLSVCGLCREGYNDPDISCVAVFRPVSKKASSLAEQMKGRSCRPLRSLVRTLNALTDPAARVEAIATSEKPNALIVDLVGITGLADCASTIQIYADGLDDEVVALAEELMEETEEEVSVEEVIEKAKAKIEQNKLEDSLLKEEEERRRVEEAAIRAKANAAVTYTYQDAGMGASVNTNVATENQVKFIGHLGMQLTKQITPGQARRIIDMLKRRTDLQEVAYKNKLSDDDWQPRSPTDKQQWKLRSVGLSADGVRSGYDASLMIDAKVSLNEFRSKKLDEIRSCRCNEELTVLAREIVVTKPALCESDYSLLVQAGVERRKALGTF